MDIKSFELITRKVHLFTAEQVNIEQQQHPFDIRNIYTGFPRQIKNLFDNSHYSQSVFEACKFVDKIVSNLSGVKKSGYKLMMEAFNEENPKINIKYLSNEKDEQQGHKWLFVGSVLAIRNPRGHELINDTQEICLDCLSFPRLP
jgi:uncharacterized protein (TIGR02391 family)